MAKTGRYRENIGIRELTGGSMMVILPAVVPQSEITLYAQLV